MEDPFERPCDEDTARDELLTDVTRATAATVTAAVRKVIDEIAAADALLIDLVRHAYLEHNTIHRAQARADVLDHVPAGLGITTAATIASRWHPLDVFDLATRAAADATLAALAAESRPESAAAVGAVWQTAVRARTRLRELGPEAEAVAARLLEHWTAPLEDLPTTAAAVASASPRTGATGQSRR